MGSILLRVMIGVAGLFAALAVRADSEEYPTPWNLPVGVTEISKSVYDLHMLIFWICCAIGVVVFGVLFYSVYAHRKSKHPTPATFHESTTVEIIWTIIPFLILVSMAVPAAKVLVKMEETGDADMTVKIWTALPDTVSAWPVRDRRSRSWQYR